MIVFGDGPQPFQNHPFIKDRERGFNLWWRGGNLFSCSGWNTVRPGGDPNGGVWFNRIPDRTVRQYVRTKRLPFFTARWGRFGIYLGYKAYGFDSPAYRDFPGVQTYDVYDGSVALTGFTARITTKLPIP